MKNFKKIFVAMMIVVLSVVGIVALAGCNKDNGNYLTVATNAEFPPFESLEGNKPVGFDIDLIDAIAKEMGYDGAKITHMDFNSVIPSVQTGKYDCAIAGLTIDEDRKEKVDFSNKYFNASQAIIYKGETKTFADENAVWEFLKGKKIGVAKGFSGDLLIQDEIAEGKLKDTGATSKQYQTGGLAVTDLANGKVDVVVIDKDPAQAFAKKFANKGIKADNTALGNEEYAIAVQKGNTELLNKINKALQTLKDNGQFDKIMNKYFA